MSGLSPLAGLKCAARKVFAKHLKPWRHVQHAAVRVLERAAEIVEQDLAGLGLVDRLERHPLLGLGGMDEGEEGRRVEGAGAVEAGWIGLV